MKRLAVGGAVALMLASAGKSAPSDLKVTGGVTGQTDAATVAKCRLTKSGTTLFHYGVRLNTGKATGLGSKSLSVVFEVVPYNGPGKYNAAEKQFGDTPVEATLQTQGIVGIDEKWLATSGVLAVTNTNGELVSGTVDADLAPTKKKAGAIHLSGIWSCTIDK